MIHLEKISLNQLICLVVLTQVGVSVLKIPYDESRYSGHDSWMSLLIGGVLAQAVILIIYQLGKRYADQTFPQYIFAIAGKPLGSVLNFLYAGFYAAGGLMVVVSYSNVISRWVLFETPWFVLIGVSLTIAAYIASSTLRPMAVITQNIVYMFLICIVIVCISGIGKGDWRHFLPVGTHGIGRIMKGVYPSAWLYQGFDLLLYVFPFVKCRKQKDILIAMSVANGFTTFLYVLISVIVLYNFSDSQMNSIPEPMVFILRKFRWPVVQSLDILFMTLWLSVTTVTVYVYLFLSARFLAFVSSKEIRKHALLVWILVFVCFLVGLWGSDRQWVFQFSDILNKVVMIMIGLVPTILLLVSLARKKEAGG